ncbi:MAG: hypothetical protein HGA80_04530 [Candidatus Omnitrophica bacterium]|nr:hypothetical protein [Candidatus Omnitrophota bacterium]
MLLSETQGWASVKCPEFRISAFADSVDEAKKRIFADVRKASMLIVSRKQRGLSVDEELLPFADTISNHESAIDEYFNEIHAS